jgi:hypothetical protein
MERTVEVYAEGTGTDCYRQCEEVGYSYVEGDTKVGVAVREGSL